MKPVCYCTSLLASYLVSSSAAPSLASAPSDRFAFLHRSALYGRVNPLGLSLESDTLLRWHFGGDPDDLLFGTAHADAGLSTLLSPVVTGVGGSVELEPIAFLVLRARVLALHYLGTFGSISELGSLDADWSPERLTELEDADVGTSRSGSMIDLGAQLRLAVGDLVALGDLRWTAMSVDASSPFYEPYCDLLLAPDDDFFVTSALLGWKLGERTLLGARWELTTGQAAEQPRQTLSAFVYLGFAFSSCLDLDLVGLAGGYLDDRYRAGEPFVAIAATLTYHP